MTTHQHSTEAFTEKKSFDSIIFREKNVAADFASHDNLNKHH